MKNSDLLLFFLIIYNIIISVTFYIIHYNLKLKNSKLDNYIEELNFELAKERRKCYYKNKEEE